MQDLFIAYFEKFSRLSEATRSALRDISQVTYFPKNEIILRQGDVCRHLYFIIKGLARIHYYHEGKEITNQFFFEGEIIADMESLYAKKRSVYQIQLLEDCCLIAMKYSALESLFAQYHDLESVGRLIAIECFLEENERNKSFQMYTAEDRYIRLLKKYPNILNRVGLGHIASYIGVSHVQLSRIRAKLASF